MVRTSFKFNYELKVSQFTNYTHTGGGCCSRNKHIAVHLTFAKEQLNGATMTMFCGLMKLK